MQTEFLYNPDGVGVHAHCPVLLNLRSGDTLVVWYAYPGDHDYQQGRIICARKSKGSDTWQKSKELVGPFQYSAGNPLLLQNPQTGEIVLYYVLLKGKYWNDSIVYYCKSDDDGRTWTAPITLTQEPGFMVRHGAVYNQDSSYLLPIYHEETLSSSLMKNWHMENSLLVREFATLPLIQPVLVRGDGDDMYMFFRPSTEPRVVWRAGSSDGGRSWSDPIQTTLKCPLSGIAAFYLQERLVVIHNDSSDKRYPLSLSYSCDGGVGWSEPIALDNSQHEVSYPDFRVDKDGIVHGVYSYNRRMIKYMKSSLDELIEYYGQD